MQEAKEQYSGVRDQEIRAALDQHWAASNANDFETEHRIYLQDAVLDYPQSGERTRGLSAPVQKSPKSRLKIPHPSTRGITADPRGGGPRVLRGRDVHESGDEASRPEHAGHQRTDRLRPQDGPEVPAGAGGRRRAMARESQRRANWIRTSRTCRSG